MTTTRSRGRPSIYTQDLADELCERLVEGLSLRSICQADDMPGTRTVFRWLRDNEEFKAAYNLAREAQADTLADQILDIADDSSGDVKADGSANPESVQRARLRVDTRKWIASKLKPKVYGERQQIDATVNGSIRAWILQQAADDGE